MKVLKQIILTILLIAPLYSMAQKKSGLDSINDKIEWYSTQKDTFNLIKFNVEKIERFGLDTMGFGKASLNNLLYYFVFKYSDEPVLLNKAIRWMEIIIKSEPDNSAFIDTYANLLYKTGRKNEAIKWERKAIKLDPNNLELADAWDKMQKGLPTWPINN